ncbi:MAG TPA: hypothetical protein VJ603_09275 [Paucimonas sp.]|nr:hypothetical protein [Paucimonas sp.]HJW54899.1 hypothetical protein [Burkholderiaceae bacterium]
MINSPASDLRCAYLPFGKFENGAPLRTGANFGAICFSQLPVAYGATAADAPFAQVPMPVLDAGGTAGTACEVWGGNGAFCYGARNAVRYGHNQDILFGVIQIEESVGAAQESGKLPLQQAAERAYREIFALTDALAFPHILRFWNYIADINGHSHGMERYQQFNTGRQDGFLGCGRKVMESAPAASAVGFATGPLTICFLAGRGAPPVAIENPRQVSAYRYPQDYGPRSPTFSRASLARLGQSDVLFLSGTASIVGHHTLHAGDVVAQTRETVVNISAMIEEANRMFPRADFSLADFCYKVYVRHAKDAAAVHAELRRLLGTSARLMFLKADICRQDLLMEIEGTAGHPFEFAIGG